MWHDSWDAVVADDDVPFLPADELMPRLVNETCIAVSGYLGETFGWKVVADPWRKRELARMHEAWLALPEDSQDIVREEAAHSGYKPKMHTRLLPLLWLTKRQVDERCASIVQIAMRCIAREGWLV